METREFIQFCKDRHDKECNQKYDGNLPYSKHLDYVFSFYLRFEHLLPIDPVIRNNVKSGVYGHDLIEDARLTYNDIVDKTNKETADIIYCCTETRGKTRDERHSESYYKELSDNPLAIFVKLCDILANATYSYLTNSDMYRKYQADYQKLVRYLYRSGYEQMFMELRYILKVT